MEKTFRMVNVGDVIYQAVIKDSQLQKNGVGISYSGYLVKEKKEISFYRIEFVITKLKFDYEYGSRPKINKAKTVDREKDIKIEVEGNNSIKCVDIGQEDDLNININEILYSTTKTTLKETIVNIINKKTELAKKIKDRAQKVIDRTMISSIDLRSIDTEDEEMEQENVDMDMETIASIAL